MLLKRTLNPNLILNFMHNIFIRHVEEFIVCIMLIVIKKADGLNHQLNKIANKDIKRNNKDTIYQMYSEMKYLVTVVVI